MGRFGDVDFGRPMWTDLGPDSVRNSEWDMNAEAILRPLLFVLLVVDVWRNFFVSRFNFTQHSFLLLNFFAFIF